MLLDAFCKAFLPEDQVELWMLCYNTVIASDSEEAAAKNRAWEERYRSSLFGEKIKILPRCPSQREVAEIMRQADCGVFLSRAEGWNLPALEITAIASNLRQYFVRVERVKRGLINTFVEPFTHGGVFHVPTADCSFYNV